MIVCILVFTLLSPLSIRADTSKDAYLGDGVVIHGGDGSGVMLIGDENVTQLMKVGKGCENDDHYYTCADGLQAYAGDGYTIEDLIKLLDDIDYNYEENGSMQTVIIYAGLNDIIAGTDYSNYVDLVNKCKDTFNCDNVKIHLVAGVSADKVTSSGSYSTNTLTTFNTYIKSITNVEVINNFESSWTDGYFQIMPDSTSDGKHFNNDIMQKWHDNIVLSNSAQDTGSMSYVTDTTNTLKVELTGVKQKLKASSETETVTETNVGVFNPKVTVIHSVNAALASAGNNVYYMPTLEDFPLDLKSLIESGQYDNSGLYHGFAAAYTGQYDLEAKAQQYSTLDQSINDTVYYDTSPNVYKAGQANRALEVLGYDFLLREEKCSMKMQDKGLYASYKVVEQKEDDDVTLETAIMDTYKALGQYCYSTQISFTPDSTLQPNTSPLQKEISLLLGANNGSAWDNTEGACWVYSTRTDPELYWNKAATEGLLSSIKDKYSTFLPASGETNITLAEFCQIVTTMMQTYGEPVLTEEEKSILLQVYGKNLPIYLENSEELESIEYLVAKGIINLSEKTDYIWSANLKTEDMLDILMAVADKDSRATFKDVQISIDPTLEEKGYYPSEIYGEQNLLTNITYTPVAHDATTYDYLIFADNIVGNAADMKVNGSTDLVKWLGYIVYKDKKYAWYQVPIDQTSVTFTNGYTEISMNGTGGAYENGTLSLFKDLSTEASEELSYLKDSYSVGQASEGATTQEGNVYLSENGGIDFALIIDEDNKRECLKQIKLAVGNQKNKTLDELTSSGTRTCQQIDIGNNRTIDIVPNSTTDESGNIAISIVGLQSKEEYSQFFSFKSSVGVKTYQFFQKDTSYSLVPVNFLKDLGLVSSVVELDSNTLEIIGQDNNVFLVQDKHYVVCGQGVYQIPQDTILYMKDASGDIYVDYRAAMGWTTPYMFFNDTATGTVTATLGKSATLKPVARTIKGALSDWTTSNDVKVNTYNSGDILLNSNYPLANYFVYYTNEYASSNGATGDYLFVFKTACSSVNGQPLTVDDTICRQLLKDLTGLDMSGLPNTLVYAYRLERTNGNGGGTKINPPGVKWRSKFGYLYEPQYYQPGDASVYSDYYSGCLDLTGTTLAGLGVHDWGKHVAIPIVSVNGGSMYDINLNTFTLGNQNFDYGVFPTAMISKSHKNSTTLSNWAIGKNTTSSETYSNIKDVTINPAPTGIIANLIHLPTRNWEAADDTKATVFYGTMPASISQGSLYIGGFKYATQADNSDSKFTVLKETATNVYLGYNTLNIQALDDTQINGDTYDPTVSEGKSREQFDWSKFQFRDAVETADDGITIATFFIINVIPRIVIFICIALIALSLITNVKPWVLFCDKFFDIYKFLTLGRKDVHTIDTMPLVWSSVIGIGIFWLFLDGSIIELFSWFVRGVVGVTMR